MTEGRRRDKNKEKETKSNPYFTFKDRLRETVIYFCVILLVVQFPYMKIPWFINLKKHICTIPFLIPSPPLLTSPRPVTFLFNVPLTNVHLCPPPPTHPTFYSAFARSSSRTSFSSPATCSPSPTLAIPLAYSSSWAQSPPEPTPPLTLPSNLHDS